MILLKRWLLLSVLSMCLLVSEGQNLLPYHWDIKFANDSTITNTVNLLSSWERQGYSYLNGEGNICTSFNIPDDCKDTVYILEVSLRMNISELTINGRRVTEAIQNNFVWSATPNYPIAQFEIPASYLKLNEDNAINVSFLELSYTGGKSYNSISLMPGSSTFQASMDLTVESEDHVFNLYKDIELDIYCEMDGLVNFVIKDDFGNIRYTEEMFYEVGKNNIFNIARGILNEGFYEIYAVLKGKGYCGDLKWVTVNPTGIISKQNVPSDFKYYWKMALEELDSVKPVFSITRVDSLCSSSKDGYVVQMNSLNDAIIYAYYFVPKKEGSYPAILHLPGYGYGFEYLEGFKNNKSEVIEMALCVRGHGISREAISLKDSPGIFGHHLHNKEELAYRAIYMDCIRAVEFLHSRKEIKHNRIGLFGASQGGGLAIATAALIPDKIAACAYFDPFPCNLPDHIRSRTMLKKQIKGFVGFYNNRCSYPEALNNLSYIDVNNLGQNITCPVFFTTGLFDDDCPSRIGFTLYNTLNSKKSFKVYPNDSHIGESGYYEDSMLFFKKELQF